MPLTRKELAGKIEHSVLHPEATRQDLQTACQMAIEEGLAGLCVHSGHVKLARSFLGASPTALVAVVGFPLGASASSVKLEEMSFSLMNGATHIDAVLNIGWIKEGDDANVRREFRQLMDLADGKPLKLILETSLLTTDEIKRACRMALDVSIPYIKTSTGFGERGASVEDVKLIRSVVGKEAKIKASGGIKTIEQTLALLEAGADRIGTSATLNLLGATQT